MNEREDCSATLPALSASDWDGIISSSTEHGLTPLLYRRLNRPGTSCLLQSPIRNTLEKYYFSNLMSNLKSFFDLKKYLAAFSKAGIDVILLKGVHLAEYIYDNPGMRVLNDIDLLVKTKDVKQAQHLISEITGSDEKSSIRVDLHWHIEQLLDIPSACVWSRARKVTFFEAETMVLSPEALLVHLCLHVSYHHLYQHYGLKTLFDLNEIIVKFGSSLDWLEVSKCASEWKVSHSVFLTLVLAKDLLGTKVPREILDALSPVGHNPMHLEWAHKQIFQKPLDGIPSLSHHFWQLFLPATISEKVKSFKNILFPSPESIVQKFGTAPETPKSRLYLARIKIHLLRYAKTSLKIIFRNPEMRAHMEKKHRDYEIREWLGS